MPSTLELIIRDPQIAYTAGSTIRGYVLLNARQDEAIASVTIHFTGTSETNLTRRDSDGHSQYHRSYEYLFALSQQLYQGHYTVKAADYKWEFEFTFPFSTGPSYSENFFVKTGSFLSSGEKYPLPPSFDHYSLGGDDQGKVEYKLRAVMERRKTGIFKAGKLEKSSCLQYMPPPPAEKADLRLVCKHQYYQVRSLKLLPGHKELTLREKTYSLFKPSDLPNATFCIRIIYPTITYPNRVLPIQLAIVRMDTSSDIPTPPDVAIKSLSIKLKSDFGFRATSNKEGYVPKFRWLFIEHQKMYVPIPQVTEYFSVEPNLDKTGKLCPQVMSTWLRTELPESGKYLDLASIIPEDGKFVTADVVPSFRTMNVSVSYRIKVKMHFECAGKDFKFEHYDELKVLPGPVDTRVGYSSGWTPVNASTDAIPLASLSVDQGRPRSRDYVNRPTNAGPSVSLSSTEPSRLSIYDQTIQSRSKLLNEAPSRPPAYDFKGGPDSSDVKDADDRPSTSETGGK
jgi:hypothetical protein